MLLYKKINLGPNAEKGNEQAKQQNYEAQIQNLQKQIAELRDETTDNDKIENVFTEKNVVEDGQERTTKLFNNELFQWLLNCSDDVFGQLKQSLDLLTVPDEIQNDIREMKILFGWVEKARNEKPKEHQKLFNDVLEIAKKDDLKHLDDFLKKDGGFEKNRENLIKFVENDANYMDALYLVSSMKQSVDKTKFDDMSKHDKETYQSIVDSIVKHYDLDASNINYSAKNKQLDLTLKDGSGTGLQALANDVFFSENEKWNWWDLSNNMVEQQPSILSSGRNLFTKSEFVDRFNSMNNERREKNNSIITKCENYINSTFPDGYSLDGFQVNEGKLQYKDPSKDADYSDVTLDNFMQNNFGDIDLTKLDFVGSEWDLMKPLFDNFCSKLMWRLSNPQENSENMENKIENCKLTSTDLENMGRELGDNMFIEKNADGNSTTYNREKMMNFLSSITNDNFKTYWNFNKPKGNGKWRALVSATQILLNNSRVDGRWTAKMEIWSKIRDYQRENKLSWNWKLTFETLSQLMIPVVQLSEVVVVGQVPSNRSNSTESSVADAESSEDEGVTTTGSAEGVTADARSSEGATSAARSSEGTTTNS